jgi:hypothetical protein
MLWLVVVLISALSLVLFNMFAQPLSTPVARSSVLSATIMLAAAAAAVGALLGFLFGIPRADGQRAAAVVAGSTTGRSNTPGGRTGGRSQTPRRSLCAPTWRRSTVVSGIVANARSTRTTRTWRSATASEQERLFLWLEPSASQELSPGVHASSGALLHCGKSVHSEAATRL